MQTYQLPKKGTSPQPSQGRRKQESMAREERGSSENVSYNIVYASILLKELYTFFTPITKRQQGSSHTSTEQRSGKRTWGSTHYALFIIAISFKRATAPKDKTVSRRELVKETWITECRKSWFESHDRGMRHPRRVIRKTIFTDSFSLLRSSLFWVITF